MPFGVFWVTFRPIGYGTLVCEDELPSFVPECSRVLTNHFADGFELLLVDFVIGVSFGRFNRGSEFRIGKETQNLASVSASG